MSGHRAPTRALLRLAAIPWRRYKWRRIRQALADPIVLRSFATRTSLPSGYGKFLDERIVEYPAVLSRLDGLSHAHILDAGSALNFEPILSHPSLATHHLTIMTLAHEQNCFHERDHDYVYGDLRNTFFRDETFDAVLSISTLEHIGLDTSIYGVTTDASRQSSEDYLFAVDEFRRVLKPGGRCLITVPCGRRAILGFLQIFDEAQIEGLIRRFHPSAAETTYYRHLPTGWAPSDRFDSVHDAGYSSYLVEGPLHPERPGAEAVAIIALQK